MAISRFHRRPGGAARRSATPLRLLALEDRSVPTATGVTDFGFEAAAVNGFQYAPGGTAWSFAGTAGVTANDSPFTAGNPGAPQGGQAAFLQEQGAINQTVTLAAGTYNVSFAAAQRANVASGQTFQVLVDGNVVGTFNSLTGTGYATLTTSSFTVADGPHTITFRGTDLRGGDNTVFIDQVAVNQQPTGLNDSAFEFAAIDAGGFKYGPTGTPWEFTGTAGLASDGSAFTSGNAPAPQASQVAFVQGTGSVSQSANFTAGTYTINFYAAQRGNFGSPQTFQVLVDGKVVGTFNNLAGTNYTPLTTSSFTVEDGKHTVTFQGTNLNGGDSTVFIDQVAVTRGLTNLGDSGFEGAVLPAGGFVYDPTGSAWTFGGTAGLTTNGSGFTSGNDAAPQGEQVAFLQGQSSVSQAVTFAAGTYAISFSAATRANMGSPQTLQVLVDGDVVGTFNNLAGSAYGILTTGSFAVTAGSHTITFRGTNLNGGDSTAFIDEVAVTQVSTGLNDASFEGLALGAGGYQYSPAGSAWAFDGSAGVAGNGGAFTSGNPSAPDGTQAAFLQQTGSMTQSVTFSAGTYTLSFAAAQRGNVASAQTLQVLVDGTVVGTFNGFSGTGYSTLTTSSFTVDAGSHTVTFQGTNLNGGDNTALIDQVAVNQQPTGLTDSGFESPDVWGPKIPESPGGFDYAPTGSAWTFTGTAGVAGNGSAFTSGNPGAPQGNQVAFLQGKSSMTQTVNFPTAGNYAISFAAAQRGNVASAQTLQVLVDGNVVGTFDALKTTSYGTLTTSSFTVTEGSHIVTFQGTNDSGDNTVFIDQVAVSAA
jgi:hypothetical protein